MLLLVGISVFEEVFVLFVAAGVGLRVGGGAGAKVAGWVCCAGAG